MICAALMAAGRVQAGDLSDPEMFYALVSVFVAETTKRQNPLLSLGVPNEEANKIVSIFEETRTILLRANKERARKICYEFEGDANALAGQYVAFQAASHGDMARLKPALEEGLSDFTYQMLTVYLEEYSTTVVGVPEAKVEDDIRSGALPPQNVRSVFCDTANRER